MKKLIIILLTIIISSCASTGSYTGRQRYNAPTRDKEAQKAYKQMQKDLRHYK